jgi:hypothetical protein
MGVEMILSGHQPVYLPGIVVLTKIALSDAFMFVGHCQYVSKSWHSRNYIRGPDTRYGGPLMLTVPVEKHMGQSIDQTKILAGIWRRKHLGSIRQTYEKRPFFDAYFPELEKIINADWGSLGCLNACLISIFCEWLEIETKYCLNTGVEGHKTDMLINMCKVASKSAGPLDYYNEYLSSPGETYIDQKQMADAGIRHHFLRFTHPVYDQGHRDFIENLSVIDLLFNVGPEAGKMVKEAGHVAG